MTDLSLLEDVVKYKKAFFNSAYANYEDCLDGNLRLSPSNDAMRKKLKEDYEQMINSGMFREDPPVFDEMTQQIQDLESRINTEIRQRPSFWL